MSLLRPVHKIGAHPFQPIGGLHVKGYSGDHIFTILDLWIHHGKGVHHLAGGQVAQVGGHGCGADIDGQSEYA